ncbi:MFS transporter [Streptomyces celluloflavus]|uniref:MFS transporter n=1 Tax=Streptomyces celluloflavus TaxID=58344 RepID=UPI0036C913DE
MGKTVAAVTGPSQGPRFIPGPRYKWVALSNTTLGMLIASINMSIMLIALPDIFRGIGVNPLQPGNTGLLLWLIMGYLVVTAVLVVSFGRLGDMYGRTRMYNLGFAVFTVFSVLLSVTWQHGTAGALWLIGMRVLQGIGGAMLMANANAILTDAFPARQRGLALGLNQVAGIAGSFLGLVLGGLLGPVDWRLVFLVSVPFGVFGTVWAYRKLRDTGIRTPARPDWWGNLTFAVGLIAVLTGITYGIQPYGGHTMGWTSPAVVVALAGGVAMLAVCCVIETKVPAPMFRLDLFRIRAFTAGNLASLLAALGRGGLMFILIIWLQGIWLPRHGYSFTQTPLWAGIYMLPLTLGFLVAGPVSGWASDRFGARIFATGGMLLAAGTFVALQALPVDFDYPGFALILLLNGIGMGLFAAPNRAAVMNSLPPDQRGVGAGISTTFQNSAMVLSIGIFFSLMIAGLASALPGALTHGLTAQGVPAADTAKVAALPPVGVLFASLLGYNPVQTLLGPHVLSQLPAGHAAYLTGREFFPRLISPPFADGLAVAFDFAIAACLIAAVASLLRGGRYIHDERVHEERRQDRTARDGPHGHRRHDDRIGDSALRDRAPGATAVSAGPVTGPDPAAGPGPATGPAPAPPSSPGRPGNPPDHPGSP